MSDSDDGGVFQAIIIRPGENEYDRLGILQGALDVPLNAGGLIEVEQIKDLLWATPHPGTIFYSPTEPAPQTAVAIGEACHLPVVELEGLTNVDFGLWQGLRWTELCRQYPRLEKSWTEHPEGIRPPNGEPIVDAVARVTKCLRRPLKKGQSFAVVVGEPLASIVRSVVTGEPLSLPACDEEPGPMLETVPFRRFSTFKRVLGTR